jgi:glycosyltransferase involved in cell wall biosynthesis
VKIVITRFGDCLIADGINLFIYELSDALISLGHEVALLSGYAENMPTGGKRSTFENIIKDMFSVNNVPTLRSLSLHIRGRGFLSVFEQNLVFAYDGSRILSEILPDMVIFNGATTMLSPAFKVAVSHDLQFRVGLMKYYDWVVYRGFDKIVAASSEIAEGLTNLLRLSVSKISTIPICIDTSRFSSQTKRKRIHAILHIGTRPEKRPDITIKAFEKIARIDSELELLIAGQYDPGVEMEWKEAELGVPPLLEQIENKEEGIRKRISLLGRLSKEKLIELYSDVKVTCVPSDYRVPVCSPTVIESLASGTPVVGSLTAISRDILIDGFTGFRVQPYDVAAYASRLRLLVGNGILWSKMSQNAFDVAQRCDKKKVAQDFLSLYRNTHAENSQKRVPIKLS